ncbi:von Willebrand factor type A domain-containing protein [Verrucomicrobiaceae bacterium 227]
MNEDLTTFIEPELEARLVALVLGEASAFEQEELERIITERPEARLFKNRMEELHGLVDEASNPVNAIAWKLSDERREKVLSKISEEQPVVASLPAKKPASQFRRRLVFYGAAACFVAVVAGLATPAVLKSEKSSSSMPVIVSYNAEGEEFEDRMDLRSTSADLGTALGTALSGDKPRPVEFTGKVSQEGKKAGDLLASIDGDYSLELPVVEPEWKSDSRRLATLSRKVQPMKAAEDQESGTLSVNDRVNTRGGGFESNLKAYLSSGQRIEVPSSEFAGKSGVSKGQTTNVEYGDASVIDDYIVSGNEGKKVLFDVVPVEGELSDAVTAAAAFGGPEIEKADGFASLSEFGFAGQLKESEESLERARTSVTRKPSAPSSSSSRVIAANTASPIAVDAIDSTVDVVREFVYPNEYEPPELPNQVGIDSNTNGFPVTPATPSKFDSKNTEFESGSNFFLGGGTVSEGLERTNADFIDSADRVKIPGIPDSPGQAVSGIVTGGLRSGSAAVSRNNIDAILDDTGSLPGMPQTLQTPQEPIAKGRGAGDAVAVKESIRRQASVQSSDDLRDEGRKAYAEGDYETATRNYRASLEALPQGTATADRRKVINDHLQDGAQALSQTYRRTGKYEEARELLAQVDQADPGNEVAMKELEYLDDPIRTNPALTYENTENTDKVRRSLYKGEGYYDLGQYDKAEEEFKEVLRTDPYNKAARRSLERLSAVKSDYHRAAYDQTRAEMLTEVDAAWGLEGTPDAKESMAKAGEPDLDLDGVTLSEKDSKKLQELGDIVQEKRKELTVQIQQQGVPYFDGRGSSPAGATGEERYRHAQRSLDDFESDREVLAQELQKVREEKTQNSEQIEDVLKSKLSILDRQVDKMREVVDNKQDATVDLSLKQNHYNQFKEDYEVARDEYRELKTEIAKKTAPARERLNKKRAILAELGEAIPSDDSIMWSAETAAPGDRVIRREVSRKPAAEDELSQSEIESIPLYDAATTWDEKSQATAKKLNEIVLPELDLSNVTVEEAMAIIREKAKEADLGEIDEFARGVDLNVRTPRVIPEDGLDDSELGSGGDPNQILIKKLNLRNVPLRVALQYVADEAKLRYKIDDAGVTLLPSGADDTADVLERRFVIPDTFETFLSTSAGSSEGDDDPFGGGDDAVDGGIKPRLGIVDILKNSGVSFPPGASATILPGSNTLIVRSTPTNLELINGIVKAAGVETEKNEEIKKQKQAELDSFETSTSQKSDSTFSLNVSDVSFKLAKSSLANGQWPEAGKVRPEEFVNALSYGDDTPTQAEKVACVIEQGSHPFMQQRNLMRVSMSTAALGRNASTPLRLTVLLDQSGSMERADRAESVRRAFALLSSQLNANDEITLIGFARTPRLLAERVKGNESGKLAQIVANPLTEGGTNLEAALSSGLQLAKQQFVEGAQNRIILLTDGAANLGDALPGNLAKQVSQMRDAGIAFDACGVGADGLNDEVLTSLAKQGDGRYYFLDRPEDADEGFARQIAGALRPAAKNVKVQVIFNPERVSKFRLYGFEKHQLKKEDFRNDSVDAAEMAAEESGVALYHFQPLPEGHGEIGTVSVRFLDTATDQMVERTWTIPYEPNSTSFSDANPTLRLASVAGLFAERLKGSLMGERVELKRLRQETELLKPIFRNQTRFQELQQMLQQAGD